MAFKLQATRLLLTYKTHIDKDSLRSWLLEEFGAKRVEIAHENGHSTEEEGEDRSYEHTHVFVEFRGQYCTRNVRALDYLEIHPHIKKITTRKHHLAVFQYLAKEDHSNDHLVEECKGIAVRVWDQKTIQDVARLAEKPSDVLGLIALYKLKKEEYDVVEPVWRPWQREIIRMLTGIPDDRTVHWVVDVEGACGKTFLAKYLHMKGQAYCVSAFGGMRDVGTIIATAIENGWDKKAFIADLPRDAEEKAIYEPIEAIKNGLVTSTKYVGSSMCFQSPHVIVFANFSPQKGRLSHDRWRIYSIDPNSSELVSAS